MAKANYLETEKAIIAITTAITEQIDKADALNGKVIALNNNYAKLPSEYLKTQKDIVKSSDDIANVQTKIQSAIEKTRLAELKLQKDREAAFDKYQKGSLRELEAVKKVSGLYNQTQIQIKKLTEVYNDLATKKALGLKLTKDEEFELYQLTEQLNRYRGTLKKVDSDVQLNQRNVGNYKAVFQDAAAAGNAFTDLLSRVFSKIRILAYILPGIGIAGIFSLALDPLFKFLGGLKFIQEAFGLETAASKAAKKALEEKTKAEAEQTKEIANSVATEQNRARILFENIKNEKISMTDRVKNFKELEDKYKIYLGDLTLQKALAGDTAEAEARLNDALAKRGLALAIQSLLQKNAEKQVEIELQYGTALMQSTNAQNLYSDAGNKSAKTNSKLRALREDEIESLDFYSQSTDDATKSTNEFTEITGRAIKQEGKGRREITTAVYGLYDARKKSLLPIKQEERALLNLYKLYAPYLDFSEKDKKNKKEKLTLTFSAIKSEYELQKAIIQRQLAEISDRMNNDKATLEARLKARQEFSKKSIELLNLEIKEENALLLEKYNDDLKKNNLAYRNKELSFKQYSENIQVLNERVNNEQQTAQARNSIKFNELLNQDLAFYKKIEEEKLKFSQSTEKMIMDLEIKKFKAIVDNARGEEFTLTIRQKAFEQVVKLQRAELDLAKIRELANSHSEEETQNIIQKYKDLNYEIDNLESPLLKAQKATDDWIKSLGNGQLEKSLNAIGLTSAKIFLDFDKNGQSSFDKLLEGAKGFAQEFAITFQAIGDITQDFFNQFTEMSNQRFQTAQDNLIKERDVALALDGDSQAAKDEINRQYEEKQRQLRRKEFQAKKQQALFNIAIDTAQGIVAALASVPPNVPLSIAIGVIGATQAGLVAAQQAPTGFWTGTDYVPFSGYYDTQEKGREIITDSRGKIKSLGSDGGSKKTWLNQGDKVLNNPETMDYLMFNNNLNNILTGNQIGSPVVEVNQSNNFEQIGREIVNAIENKAEFSQLITDGELKNLVKKANQTTEIMNRRRNFKPKSV